MEALLESIGMPNTPQNALYAGSAVEWVNVHTTLKIDAQSPDSLSAAVKLFIMKYSQLMANHSGVSSESISGLSQSFVTGQSLEMQIFELATALLGLDCIKSTVTVYAGEDVWEYGR